MLFTGEMLIGLFLSFAVPYALGKLSRFLQVKSDPPWKKKP
ncbi:hypothetical protein [Cohnella hashimotonis]|uniref:Uncharacterized protein n=1 Tax=Cohnella hashimotonis TaxID=2826895 RepID=A0ABT6TEI6_9BACL|nr:hypothetical protein [Cohnella hashimotonis]MDI4644740.1 hypothetical protein [Cohnella hashimotonis]